MCRGSSAEREVHHEALAKFILEQDINPQQRGTDPCHVNWMEILPPSSQLSFSVGNFGSRNHRISQGGRDPQDSIIESNSWPSTGAGGCMQASGADETPHSPRINIPAAGIQIPFIWAGAVPLPDQPSGSFGRAPYKQL